MKTLSSILAAAILAAAAGSASGALVTIGGNFGGSFGNSNVLAVNGQSSTSISGNIGGASFSGVVNASSFDGGCNLLLTLTQFSFTSSMSGNVTLTVTIVQDYDIPVALGWTGSHQFNGDANFSGAGQSASLNVTSTHETTALPTLNQAEVAGGPGTVVFNRGQGPTTVVTPVATPYRIATTYTFVLNRGATGSVVFNLPDSGVDQASCVQPIPLPSAGLAGLAGILGVAGIRRRRLA
ncbi:MAG: hypothetical protein AB7G11_06660 [Phycisphaerales bacterium]